MDLVILDFGFKGERPGLGDEGMEEAGIVNGQLLDYDVAHHV